jgi:3-oxoacyl-(acyl-carrier-protein) synthase
MAIFVRGIGWVSQTGYGCIRTGLNRSFSSAEGCSLLKQDIFVHPFRNFGRLDKTSKMTAYAVALALRDSGMDYSPGRKQDIGIIGTSREGSLNSDIDYFKDYIENGRTASRGNLFIYTLPSSPLGEAAIHFGFVGPILYAAAKENSIAGILDMAGEMLNGRETATVLAGSSGEQESFYFVLGAEADGGALCDFAEARSLAESSGNISSLKDNFFSLLKNCVTRKASCER